GHHAHAALHALAGHHAHAALHALAGHHAHAALHAVALHHTHAAHHALTGHHPVSSRSVTRLGEGARGNECEGDHARAYQGLSSFHESSPVFQVKQCLNRRISRVVARWNRRCGRSPPGKARVRTAEEAVRSKS